MKISIIVPTYNAPKWLINVLIGLEEQQHKHFEVVVADDGSNKESVTSLTSFSEKSPLSIQHIWHKDDGFRKCEILNKAILACHGDYIIFLDGDCIPKNDFVQQHLKYAKKGRFLTGAALRLPLSTSRKIDKSSIQSGQCFTWQWLRNNGMPSDRKSRKLLVPSFFHALANTLSPARTNFKGGNSSAWKDDLIKVGGFDQRMPWGGEDRELGVRLKNAGIKARHVRYNALVFHLDHPRGYVDLELVKKNKALRVFNEKNKIAYTKHGFELLENK